MIGTAPPVREAYLSLGSNQGDRLDFLNRAISRFQALEGVALISVSPVYESRAHLKPGQGSAPDFLNAVIHVRTTLDPIGLLAVCVDVEHRLGRIRGPERWLPRTLDIDILLVDGVSRSDDRLTLPHPRMHERRFVLQPLCDIDPDLHVPAPFDASAKDLLANCRDTAPVSRYADSGG